MGRQNDKKRAVILRRRFAKASKNLGEGGIGIARYQEALREVRESGDADLECDIDGEEEAITEIARYQEALREVRESGDADLECDVLADGVDVVVDGRQWILTVYPDGWSAFYTGLERDEGAIDGRLGPADLSPTELVYRLSTGQRDRIDTSWSPGMAARVRDWSGGGVSGRSVSSPGGGASGGGDSAETGS
jgi:hypothetical protein